MRVFILLSAVAIALLADVSKVEQLYANAEYEQAIAEARASKGQYSHAKLHLLWAKSAEALGRYEEAMSAYERVLILDEKNIDAKVALLKLYRSSKRKELAAQIASELREAELSKDQKELFQKSDGDDRSSISAKAFVVIGHDTNVNMSASAKDIDLYLQSTGNQAELATLFAKTQLSIGYNYEFEEASGWFMRGDANLIYQNNFDAHDYDALAPRLEAALGYSGSDFAFALPLAYEKLYYLQSDLYQKVRLEPRLTMAIDSHWMWSVNLIAEMRSYNPALYRGMDDQSLGLQTGVYYMDAKDYLFVTLRYENVSALKDPSNYYVDKSLLGATVGGLYNLENTLAIKAEYGYRRGSYDDVKDLKTPSIGSKREDNYHQAAIKIFYKLSEASELFAEERYAHNDSNYLLANYDKNTVMLGISMSY